MKNVICVHTAMALVEPLTKTSLSSSIVILILIYCFFSFNFVVSEFMSIFASRINIY